MARFSKYLLIATLSLALVGLFYPYLSAQGASISFDSTGSSSQSNGSDISWSHTIGSGSDQVLFVAVYSSSEDDDHSATYGGQSMTKAESSISSGGTPNHVTTLWYLVNPPSGSNTVQTNGINDDNAIGASASYNNVDTSNPIGSTCTDNVGVGGGNLSCSLSSFDSGHWNIKGASHPDTSGFSFADTTRVSNVGDTVTVGMGDGTDSTTSVDGGAFATLASVELNDVPIELPTLSTNNPTNVATSSLTANGNIDNTGGENNDERGFVYDTTSRADPGNTSPAASAYPNVQNETGSFGTGSFSLNISGLSEDTTYFIRSYSHNSAGYSYGAEVSTTTDIGIGSVMRTLSGVRQTDNAVLRTQ